MTIRLPLFFRAPCVRLVLLLLGLWVAPAQASWGVGPLTMDLDLQTRSGVFNVWNSGTEEIFLQIRARRWEQDAAGKDVYTDTREIILFPLQVRLAPNEQRVVRVGYRNPARDSEIAYRVVFEQAPPPATGAASGSAIGVSLGLAFALPVYLRPSKVLERSELKDLKLAKGRASVTVENPGNVRFRVSKVRFVGVGEDGRETVEKILDGWYLLAAAQRDYTVELPRELCERTRALTVEIQTEQQQRSSRIAVTADMCS